MEELGIPIRDVTGKMLGWSDTEENVLRLHQITKNSAQHTNVIISEKIKKIEHFSPTLLKGFPT